MPVWGMAHMPKWGRAAGRHVAATSARVRAYSACVAAILLASLICAPARSADPEDIERLRKEKSCTQPQVGCDLGSARLRNWDLDNADLTRANLVSADLTRTRLQSAKLNGANLHLAKLPGADLSYADLSSSSLPTNLQNSDLSGTTFIGANLESVQFDCAKISELDQGRFGARFINAKLRGATFIDTKLAAANFSGADMRQTDFRRGLNLSCDNLEKGTVLDRVKFAYANLAEARFDRAQLIDTDLTGADLSGTSWYLASFQKVRFEPKQLPEVIDLWNVSGLDSLYWVESPKAMVQLRRAFREAGMRQPERELTYAIAKSQREKTGGIESAFQYALFEATSLWGMSPGRPLIILICLIPFFALPYAAAISSPTPTGSIWRLWDKNRLRRSIGQNRPELISTRKHGWFFLALYFSLLSAFNIGWRELNIGNWIVRLNPYEFTLQGSGWVRSVSLIQSVVSVYLLAIAALTYFGRPFE
jgi:uncharacterized protein YjbI with pentapeptide repeats